MREVATGKVLHEIDKMLRLAVCAASDEQLGSIGFESVCGLPAPAGADDLDQGER